MVAGEDCGEFPADPVEADRDSVLRAIEDDCYFGVAELLPMGETEQFGLILSELREGGVEAFEADRVLVIGLVIYECLSGEAFHEAVATVLAAAAVEESVAGDAVQPGNLAAGRDVGAPPPRDGEHFGDHIVGCSRVGAATENIGAERPPPGYIDLPESFPVVVYPHEPLYSRSLALSTSPRRWIADSSTLGSYSM